jgi:cytochrome c
MGLRVVGWVAVAAALAAGSAHAEGDAAKGKQIFAKCAICHDTAPGKNKIGPSLAGIVGRKPASEAGFSYSDAMKKLDAPWDEKALDTYLTNPRQAVPGTKMIFAGLKEAGDRSDLIAYLKTLQ